MRKKILLLPWVSMVNVTSQNGRTAMLVSVTDDAKAEDCLLEEIQACGVKVMEFGRKKLELEDVYMNVVGGKGRGN